MNRSYERRFEDRIEGCESLDLHFEPRAKGSVFVLLKGEADEIEVRLDSKEYSDVKVFLYNAMDREVKLTLKSDVAKDAVLHVGLLDLQDMPFTLKAVGELNEQGAAMDFSFAQLCLYNQRKHADVDINSRVPHTYGTMHNYAVCFDSGVYEMAAAGRIVKGAFGSESHQETRVLTMGKDHKTVVIPILYIDENDVKASHALSVGQPDQDQMYYLQSRGLNPRQAIGLLSIGYFKPVLELIEDEALRESIARETEQKVGLHEN